MKLTITDSASVKNSQIEFEIFDEPLTPLRIEWYTEKSFAVFGSTKEFKTLLKGIGGNFRKNLDGSPGWIFSKRYYLEVEKLVNIINSAIDNDEICLRLVGKSTFSSSPVRGKELRIVPITEGTFHLIGDAGLFEEELTSIGCVKEFDDENNETVWDFTRNKLKAVNALVNAVNKLL